MSSNHTRVNNSEWDEMLARIAQTDAYVINRRQEAERIAEIAAQRRSEAEAIHDANRRTIQNAVEAIRTSFSEAVGMIGGQVNTQFRARIDEFNDQLDSLRLEVSNAYTSIAALDRRIENIAGTYNQAFQNLVTQSQQNSERANIIQEELSRLLSQIAALNPQHFTPVDYASLISLRDSLEANMNAGDHQAAILVSQNGMINATRLLARLVIINQRYSNQLQTAQNLANELWERTDNLSSRDGVLQIESNGEIQEFDYDLSFWSFGRFDTLTDELHRIQAMLDDSILSEEQLEDTITRLENLDLEISACDINARRERVAAAAAADTAMCLHNGLSASGWSLIDSGYNDEDERNPYAMTYDDNAGNTVSVVVTPESSEKPSFFLEVFSYDDELAAMTKEGVHASLQEEGITIDEIEYRNDCHLNPDPVTFMANATEEALLDLEQRRQIRKFS